MAKARPLRIVLVGPTGAGKSTTGNLLVNDNVFEESGGWTSCTTEVREQYVHANTDELPMAQGYYVVDTPGLGDKPMKNPGESLAEHRERCYERREQVLDLITSYVYNNGGCIFFVTKASDRLEDSTIKHLRLLSKVLNHMFSSSVVLLVTKVPDHVLWVPARDGRRSHESEDACAERKRAMFMSYGEWLSKTRDKIQSKIQLVIGDQSLQFAGVLGVADPGRQDVCASNPASKHVFRQLVVGRTDVVDNMRIYQRLSIRPRTIHIWSDMLRGAVSAADAAMALTSAIQDTRTKLEEAHAYMETISNQMRHCARTVVAGAVLAAVLEPLGWAFLLPGIGSAVGATVAGVATGARAMWEQKKKDLKNFIKKMEADMSLQHAELSSYGGVDGARFMQEQVEHLKDLAHAAT